MKKPLLFAVFTALSLCISAQSKTNYLLYQSINEDYDGLYIAPHCKLKLVKSDKDRLEVSIMGDSTLPKSVCSIKNGQLRIKYPKKSLDDAEIILYTSKHFSSIKVRRNATLIADTLQLNLQNASVDISIDGQIKADKFIGGTYNHLSMGDNSLFECPDVSADSVVYSITRTSKGSGLMRFRQLPLAVYRQPSGVFLGIHKDIDILKMGNKKYDNPSVSNLRCGLSFPILYVYPFANGDLFKAGLEYKLDLRLMFNEVNYDRGDFSFANNDPAGRVQQFILSRSLLLPLKYDMNVKDGLFKFSFGLSFGRVLKSNLYEFSINKSNKFDIDKTKINNLNPWKIEAGIDVSGDYFFGLHLEFFANILPLYKNGTRGDDIREVGVRINF